jgi:hypothetical protein
MPDLTNSADATINAIDDKYKDHEYRMAARLGTMQALVMRLAISADVYGNQELKEQFEQIFLDYQSR